jgi:N-acyl-D-aspartate/D-glutamate deacylase
MTDLVIRGGLVVDGTGAPPLRADIAIDGGFVEKIGVNLGDGRARVIDAAGLVVAPGFFDFHSHADFTLPNNPSAINSISQGVTTEVVGVCGFSPAPLAPDRAHAAIYQDSMTALGPELEWRWSTFGEFLTELERVRPPVNCAPLVGHNALRSAVMGYEDRKPTERDLGAMANLVAEAMKAGAWGMSSGLIFSPGTYSDVEEMASLGAVVAGHGGIYASHIRNEGAGLIGAVEEALEVGRRSGVPVNISHLKATGADNFGLVQGAFDALDQARSQGIMASCDVYPYTAGSCFLAVVTPGWVQEGGFDKLVERLGSGEIRERLKHEMRFGLPGWNSIYKAAGGWDRFLISSVTDESLRSYEGLSIKELAGRAGVDPFEFTFDLLVADRAGTAIVVFLMDEKDVREVVSYPWSVIGSDQILVTSRKRNIHPRAYGSFAKVLGRFVREESMLPLETAIHKMTGLPAAILGMSDRGRLAVGLVADLVLFDPAAIVDRADYSNSTALAQGVELVLLSGEAAFEAGEATQPGLGRVLRHRARRSVARPQTVREG